jgi:hypothetical protein
MSHESVATTLAEQTTAQELLWHDVGELWRGFEVVYVSPHGNIFATSEQWDAIKAAGITLPLSNCYVVRKEVASSVGNVPWRQERIFTRKLQVSG